MFLWSYAYNRLLEWNYNRKVKESQTETEKVADGFWELYHLAATFHGRLQLMHVVIAADNEEVEADPKVIGLYRYVLLTAPYAAYATFN